MFLLKIIASQSRFPNVQVCGRWIRWKWMRGLPVRVKYSGTVTISWSSEKRTPDARVYESNYKTKWTKNIPDLSCCVRTADHSTFQNRWMSWKAVFDVMWIYIKPEKVHIKQLFNDKNKQLVAARKSFVHQVRERPDAFCLVWFWSWTKSFQQFEWALSVTLNSEFYYRNWGTGRLTVVVFMGFVFLFVNYPPITNIEFASNNC